MAALMFQNSQGNRRQIAVCETMKEVMTEIRKFLDAHEYKSYYIRTWIDEDKTWFDVGSWSEFFIWEDGGIDDSKRGSSSL